MFEETKKERSILFKADTGSKIFAVNGVVENFGGNIAEATNNSIVGLKNFFVKNNIVNKGICEKMARQGVKNKSNKLFKIWCWLMDRVGWKVIAAIVAAGILMVLRIIFSSNSSIPTNNGSTALRARDNSQIYIMGNGSVTTNGFKQAVDLDKNSTFYSEGKLNFNN